ncbi:unnamed protein product [Kuraishia capsulata CBS 1993]|uniref:Coatomer subunit epsilon n=1 Tax=Kuraishia capsulata CBS 1993 TaxID=1382522 RepID=W6MS94_9ASCO|nr:uncharacterized protein KUCA_T00004058001 [Kuraishia capsulata CBS 1993]CDK28077.1 unnamed protein product [Kuraishia capsulata CBS 1993]
MDPFSDTGDLYQIKQQFFCGQYDLVVKHGLDSFSAESHYKATEYVVRSHFALESIDDALKIIKEDETEGEDAEKLKFLAKYATYLKSRTGGESSDIDEYIENFANLEIVAVLGSVYLINLGKLNQALELLSGIEASLETIALTVQIRILTGKLELAQKELSYAKKWAQDDIVFNFAEAWANLSVGSLNNLQSAFYFFEEIAQGNTSFKGLVSLLGLNLQLHHFVESKEVLNQLEQLAQTSQTEESLAGDYLANKVSYDAITGEADFEQTVTELREVAPSHQFVVDYDDKLATFDGIVAKYAEQIEA